MPLLIRIDLIPGGDYRQAREIARGWIVNDMTGTPEEANYRLHLTTDSDGPMMGKATGVFRNQNVWRFLEEALRQAVYR